METLTKENFWNSLMDKYSGPLNEFRTWLDSYKKSVNWDDLFANKKIFQREHYWADIKFHNLPADMQFGIILRYMNEKEGRELQIETMKSIIDRFFNDQQNAE